MRKTLSVAMIAMNEEANLARTLETVKWADEIIVVDSGSKDRTLEIAQSFGAKTSYHAFGGHGEQKNVALDLCTSDWILLQDADEAAHARATGRNPATARRRAALHRLLDPPPQPHHGPLDAPRWVLPRPQATPFKRGAARLSEGVGPHSTPQHEGPRAS